MVDRDLDGSMYCGGSGTWGLVASAEMFARVHVWDVFGLHGVSGKGRATAGSCMAIFGLVHVFVSFEPAVRGDDMAGIDLRGGQLAECLRHPGT